MLVDAAVVAFAGAFAAAVAGVVVAASAGAVVVGSAAAAAVAPAVVVFAAAVAVDVSSRCLIGREPAHTALLTTRRLITLVCRDAGSLFNSVLFNSWLFRNVFLAYQINAF